MKRKTDFYFKVSEEYSKLEQKLGSELLLDEIFINIEINELTKVSHPSWVCGLKLSSLPLSCLIW